MGDFNFNIPDELHKEFKKKSIDIDKDMKDILVELIFVFLEKEKVNGKKKGKDDGTNKLP